MIEYLVLNDTEASRLKDFFKYTVEDVENAKKDPEGLITTHNGIKIYLKKNL